MKKKMKKMTPISVVESPTSDNDQRPRPTNYNRSFEAMQIACRLFACVRNATPINNPTADSLEILAVDAVFGPIEVVKTIRRDRCVLDAVDIDPLGMGINEC